MRILPLFALLGAGCLGQPDTSELCFENRQTVWEACDVETTEADEDFARQQCARDAGFAVAQGCAGEVQAWLTCVQEVSEGTDCEDLPFDQAEMCAFEQGVMEGCLSP